MIITTPNKAFEIPLSCKEVGLCQTSTFLCFFKICRMKIPIFPPQANLRTLCRRRAQLVMTGLQLKWSASQERTTNPLGLLLQHVQTLSGCPPHSPRWSWATGTWVRMLALGTPWVVHLAIMVLASLLQARERAVPFIGRFLVPVSADNWATALLEL